MGSTGRLSLKRPRLRVREDSLNLEQYPKTQVRVSDTKGRR